MSTILDLCPRGLLLEKAVPAIVESYDYDSLSQTALAKGFTTN